jgi:hypothetical protein
VTYSTADFARLYGIVTKRLSPLAADPYWRQKDQREWLAYLIVVFEQLFEDWEHDANLATYLDALEKSPGGRPVHRVFRLAGHVYLHVAYDLVRGVAGTLDSKPPVLRNELHIAASRVDTFVNPAPVMVKSRPDARLTFLAAAPAFSEALDSDEGVDLLGDVTFWARALGVLTRRKRRLALQAIGQWVLALRNAALITAEIIADAPPPMRAGIVQRLRAGIENAQTSVANRFRITDVQPWGFPILEVATPFALVAVLPWAALIAVLVVWIGGIAFIRRRQHALLEAIDAFGVAILDALIAARHEREKPAPR